MGRRFFGGSLLIRLVGVVICMSLLINCMLFDRSMDGDKLVAILWIVNSVQTVTVQNCLNCYTKLTFYRIIFCTLLVF